MLSILRTSSDASRRRPASRPGLELLEGRALLAASALRLTVAATATAGDVVPVTVAAENPTDPTAVNFLGTVHFTSSDAAAVLPADYTYITSDASTHAFTVRLMTAGATTLTVMDKDNPALTATTTVTVAPSALHHFDVTLSDSVVAGAQQVVTVTARDAAGNVLTDYVGPVHFQSTDTGAKLPPDHTFTSGERGVFQTTLALSTVGRQTVQVGNGVKTGQTAVNVAPGPAVSFSLALPSRVPVNQPQTVRVRALDDQGNLVTYFAGTVHVTASDTALSLPSDHTFKPEDGGQWSFVVTPHAVGDFVLTVTDTARSQVRGSVFYGVRYGTATQNYVEQLYRGLLGRSADAAGLAHWSTGLDRGASRVDVIGAIQRSAEYRTNAVTSVYQSVLDRDPDAGGLSYFVNLMGNGRSLDDITALLMASEEYLQNRGAGLNEGFVAAAFVDLLGRQPDATSTTFFVDRLGRGTPRDQVVRELLISAEASTMVLRDTYAAFLEREPDPAALAFVTAQGNGLSSEGLVLAVLASDEYFGRTG